MFIFHTTKYRWIQHCRRLHRNVLTRTWKTWSCTENKNNVQLHPNPEIFRNHSFVRSEPETCTRGVRDSLRVARNNRLRLKILLTIRFDTCIRCEKTEKKLITSAQLHTGRKNDVNTKTVKTHTTRWQRITVGLGSFQWSFQTQSSKIFIVEFFYQLLHCFKTYIFCCNCMNNKSLFTTSVVYKMVKKEQ